MEKNRVRINESQLRNIIAESVKKVLKESTATLPYKDREERGRIASTTEPQRGAFEYRKNEGFDVLNKIMVSAKKIVDTIAYDAQGEGKPFDKEVLRVLSPIMDKAYEIIDLVKHATKQKQVNMGFDPEVDDALGNY